MANFSLSRVCLVGLPSPPAVKENILAKPNVCVAGDIKTYTQELWSKTSPNRMTFASINLNRRLLLPLRGQVTSENMAYYVGRSQRRQWDAVDEEYYAFTNGERSLEQFAA